MLEADLACYRAEQRGLADAVEIDPCSRPISPAIARNNVVLPMPLRPTSPTRAPSGMRADASSSSSRPATRIEILSSTSMRALLTGARRLATAIARRARRGDPRPSAKTGVPFMCVPGCREAVYRAMSRRGFFRHATTAAFAATAIAPAYAQRSFTSVIDLTHTLSPGFPTFFGTPGITIEQRYTLKKDGANVNWWHVPEHAGTHLDAPFHYSDAGAAVEAIPAEQLIVPFAVVDVSAKAARNPDYAASRDDLAEWEGKNGRLPDGCCVAMHSGWAQHASNAEVYRQGRCR